MLFPATRLLVSALTCFWQHIMLLKKKKRTWFKGEIKYWGECYQKKKKMSNESAGRSKGSSLNYYKHEDNKRNFGTETVNTYNAYALRGGHLHEALS